MTGEQENKVSEGGSEAKTNGHIPATADSMSVAGSEATSVTSVPTDTEDTTIPPPPAPTLDRSVFLRNLKFGFEQLKLRREEESRPLRSRIPRVIALQQAANQSSKDAQKSFNSFVTVNFIDPTTANVAAPASTPTTGHTRKKDPPASPTPSRFSFGMGATKATALDTHVLSLGLYEKLHKIFVRDYDSLLHGVPYEHIRSGAPGTIEKLPIEMVLTRSHGSGMANNGDASVPWAGTSGAAAAPVSDPAEWHNGPYCHVYIAACESMEHYRAKVRPAIHAFVSQIEGASGATRTGSTHGSKMPVGSTGNYSAHYVICYVPIRTANSSNNGGSNTPPQENARGFGQRLAAARRRMETAAATVRDTSVLTQSSVHSSTTTTGSSELDLDSFDPAAAPPPGPIAHSSKSEKELFKKLNADFPSGRTCILSTLLDSDDATNASPLKNQEWNTFLRMLGSAIVSGFRDRCRRYDDELRRLDAARANMNKPVNKMSKKAAAVKFDLSHFFLVKESLAFTFEQMQLPEEALLQYEELRAFLPSGNGNNAERTGDGDEKRQSSSKKLKSTRRVLSEFDDTALGMAIAGDTIGFRRRLRSATDLTVIEQMVLHYMFAREVSLYFQMATPEKIMASSLPFVKTLFRMKLLGIGVLKNKSSEKDRMKEAERWAIDFCWDFKIASENFFTSFGADDTLDELSFTQRSNDGLESTNHSRIDPEVEDMERVLASHLADLLEFARVLYLQLGDTELPCPNPIRLLSTTAPKDISSTWQPWQAETSEPTTPVSIKGTASLDEAVATENGIGYCDEPDDDEEQNSERLLEGALESSEAYETKYVELSKSISMYLRNCGKPRLASRLQAEMAEMYIRSGDYTEATRILLPISNVCGINRWDRCHFWRLFRLACCQRKTGKVASYLNTLTQCFGPHLTPDVAPKKVSELLHADFQAVVSVPRVSGYRLGIASFVETELDVSPTSGGKSSMLLNFVRKKFLKSLCKVGEEVTLDLKVASYLPKTVELKALQIVVVALSTFEDKFTSKLPVTEEDASEVLNLEAPVTIKPGLNVYKFRWMPLATGMFMLSTVQLQLQEACFHYDSVLIRRPLMGIEVQPSKPTQSLELNPLFLIPGQVQQLRVSFHPGTDIIEEGILELFCSDGLELIPPGEDPNEGNWTQACEFALPPCRAGEPVVIITTAKSNQVMTIEDKLGLRPDTEGEEVSSRYGEAMVQTLQAKVSTRYRHELDTNPAATNADTYMTTVLEAMVTTLDKPALTVDSCEILEFGDNDVLVQVGLHCNTPVPFSIKEWQPNMLGVQVKAGGDMNEHLFDHAVSEGEQLTFGFHCTSTDSGGLVDSDETPTLLIVLQDEFGKTFNQVLPLNLDYIYDRMRKDDELVAVVAELSCSKLEGLVGAPVTLTFNVDASRLTKPKNYTDDEVVLLYELCCDETSWITGGKVQGVYVWSKQANNFRLDFVGIPVDAGVLKNFPKLTIKFKSKNSPEHSLPPIAVNMKNPPESFKSLSFVNHMALACPSD